MPEDKKLFQLLHISDLHFGEQLEGRDKNSLDASLPLFLRYFPRFDGLLGHHYRALTALHDFYKELWKDDAGCPVIISGDLTANGSVAQFRLANGYLAA